MASTTLQFASAADSAKYIRQLVRNDSAGAYNCGAGVRFTLASLGIPHLDRSETQAQHGYRWAEFLSSEKMREAGWKELDLNGPPPITPEKSPPGVVWVYDRNHPPATDGTGRQYGHVEIALGEGNGYAAGAISNRPGGSVRHNSPRAFVHPKLTALVGGGPIDENTVKDVLTDAQRLARERTREAPDKTSPARDFAAVSYDLNTMDFSNVDFAQLIEMLLNIFLGLHPMSPMGRVDLADNRERLDVPAADNTMTAGP